MRLIDADALIDNKLERMIESFGIDFGRADVTFGLAEIDNAPTVEAEPIRHGHWVENEEGYFSCSNCHNDAMVELYENSQKLTLFCPYCGATMDESEAKK